MAGSNAILNKLGYLTLNRPNLLLPLFLDLDELGVVVLSCLVKGSLEVTLDTF